MASWKKISGKKGDSYRFEVVSGTDQTGKKIRHYKTWHPEGMTPKQIEKALPKIAADFEREIEQGFDVTNKQNFMQYADYVLNLKKQSGTKQRTLERYEELLERINPAIGHLLLNQIKPQTLNILYQNLAENGIRKDSGKCTPKAKTAALIEEYMRENALPKYKYAELAGTAVTNVNAVLNGDSVAFKTAAKVISPLFGLTKEDVSAIKKKVEQLFTVKYDTTPLSPKTILEHHRLISTILSQAEKEMIIPFNPASRATPPKQNKKEAETLQPKELEAVIEALQKEPLKWQCITDLLMTSGCRRGEIMGLCWDCVDFDSNTIFIKRNLLYSAKNHAVYIDSPKTHETRYVTLPEESMNLLKSWQASQALEKKRCGEAWITEEYDFCFTQPDGRRMHPDSITNWLNDFSKRNKLPALHPHLFRHSMASLLISAKVDIVAVSKRLGHAKVSTTSDIYSHIIKAADAKSADCIADVLFKKPTQQQAQAQ